MSRECEQIPESFIRDLEQDRRNLVRLLKKTKAIDLDLFSRDTYPDDAHLLFELLQNAEDTGATAACFKLDTTKLSFTHDGRPFSKKDVLGIIRYGSDGEDPDKIGRFGIGFKSVYAYSETPRIYSDTVAFKIVDRIVPRTIDRPARHSTGETLIELPLDGQMKPIEDVRGEIRQGLQEMSAMSILHLRNIRSIDWRTDDGRSGSIRRAELDERVVRIDAMRRGGTERRFFLRFREPYAERPSMHLDVAFELDEKEQEQDALVESDEALSDRFRIGPAEPGSVAVFFPAVKETSKLRFHLHAPFITPTDRASVKEHADNDVLFGRLAKLVARSLPTIRDMGLLDREFLGVLPNSRDRLPEAYGVFREVIVRAMREQPLMPMQSGGHERADRLLQGRREFKDLLGVDDIRFLMSGWDYDMPNLGYLSPRTDRSTVPSSAYRGWAVAARPGNPDADHFLKDLAIHEFRAKHLAPPTSKAPEKIEEWLKAHDVAWHGDYYAAVAKHWDVLRPAHDRLQKLPMVRARSAEYRRGRECRFPNDGGAAPAGVTLVDPDTYSHGKRAEDAKQGLERLGVSEIDDESRAIGILEKYYGKSGHRPTWDEHRNHVESFIELVRSGRVPAQTFRNGLLLLDSVKDWEPPDRLYAGDGYQRSSGAPYYQTLEALERSPRFELHRRYRNIQGFSDFARRIDVALEIPIEWTPCDGNPAYGHLRSGGGVYETGNGTDRDWHVPHLDLVLQRATQAGGERQSLARAIHAALKKARKDTWPPPDDPPLRGSWSYEPIDTGRLVAIYRRNTNASFRTAPSQLVATLRSHAWIPQEQDGDGLVFVKPGEARRDALPDGFTFDSGWAWIKAVGFGEARREREQRIAQGKLDQEAEASERTAMAKGLGFASSEEAEFFAGLPEKMKKEVRARFESMTRSGSDFDRPPNPDRRRKMARKRAEVAPKRTARRVERIIVEEEDQLKAEARTELRAHYEQRAHVSLCQVSGCEDRSFKLKDGVWYFEAVRFLDLDRMVAADYVALCPRHARMFRHANESDGLKQRVAMACAAGDHVEGITIPVVLAGENVSIRLAPKHAIDLVAALEVDGDEQAG